MKKKRRKEKGTESVQTISHDPATLNALVDKGLLYFYGTGGVRRDYSKARTYLSEAANAGIAKAQEIVGLMLLNGMGCAVDAKEGIRYMSMAAEQNSAFALWQMGMACANGIVVEKNLEKAVECYTNASDQNFASARFELGLLYMYGTGVPKDEEKGGELISRAADDGCDLAVRYLARKEVDPKKSRELFEKAIQLGCIDAKYDLAVHILITEKKAARPLQVAELLEDCVRHYNADAIFLLGMLFLAGFFGTANKPNAISYFRAGAKLRDPKALYILGYLLYSQGQYDKALEYFMAARKYKFPYASYALAVLYLMGEGVEKNVDLALAYCNESVVQGLREGEYLFGWMFEHGEGVVADKRVACEWFEKSRSKGYGPAAFALAAYAPDEQKAHALYEEAAACGYGEAYAKLGQLIEEKDLSEAVKLYEKGARLSNATACLALQRILTEGPDPDPERAEQYAKKAELFSKIGSGPSYLPVLEISKTAHICLRTIGVEIE
ncbi:MAG: sel1 repeat family protein [Desulfovibrionaceae bacterium]|nr:sel1 repeat family protein [Desulfovibrionaceae bacterium]